MEKRILAVLLVMLLSASILTGCKKSVGTPEDNAVSNETEEEEDKPEYRFGFTCITMENPYFIALEAAVRDEVQAQGHTMVTKDPGNDSQKQIEQIQDMIEDGIHAIFLCPVDWEEITPALEALKEADVRIINIDTQVKEADYVDAYVGSDNKNAGKICGEDLIKKRPDGGKIAILESTTMNSVNDRITGFEEAILDHGFEVVSREDTKGDLNEAISATERILKKNPDITAIMCGNDPTALGALVAVRDAGLKDIMIYGVDGSPDLKKELQKTGTQIAGTGAQSPINMGKTAAKTGINMLNGEDYEEETYEETFLIDKTNLELYGVDGWQ